MATTCIRTSNLRPSVAIYGEPNVFSQGKNRRVSMLCCVQHQPAAVSSRIKNSSCLSGHNSFDFHNRCQCCYFEIPKSNSRRRSRERVSRMVVQKAMFERFNVEAIKVIMLSQEEGRRLGHNFVGTEQLLLGLINEDTGIAAKVLKSMGINLKDARVEVEKIIGRGRGFVAVEIPFTPRAKRVLELSLEEAEKLGHNDIGTEHLLLGLLREGEGIAARVFENLGVDPSNIHTQVIKKVSSSDNEVIKKVSSSDNEMIIESSSFSDPKAMFRHFTEEAIIVIMLAQEEARCLGHNFVGTEQILLGLIGEGTCIAGKVLKSMGINLKDARVEVEKIIGRGSGFVPVEIPFTPRAQRVLDLSLEEAKKLVGLNYYVGPEHLLLGLIREGDGVAARVLANLGVDPSNIRAQVIKKVSCSDNEVIDSSSFSDPLNQVSTDKQRKFHRGSLRSCTKVQKHGNALGRSVDLAKFNGYDELIAELDQLFEFNGELKARNNNWLIVYTDDEGDLMLVGDDPWQEFGNMVRKIYIYTRDEVQRMNPKKGA